jgi:hypothetical protein
MVVGIPSSPSVHARAGGDNSPRCRGKPGADLRGLHAGDIAALLVLIGLPHRRQRRVLEALSCDESTARRSALLASLSKVVFGLSVAAIALAARAPPAGGETLPRAILAFVPSPLASLVLVALVATIQTIRGRRPPLGHGGQVQDILPALVRRPYRFRGEAPLPSTGPSAWRWPWRSIATSWKH